jgi:HEAT repeat protein
MKSRPSVDALARQLHDSDSEVRRTAAEGLGQIGDPAAVQALVEAAGSEDDFRAKVAIAVAMVKLDHPNGLKMVAAFIGDAVPGNRNHAAAMITSIDAAKLQIPEIVNPLIAAINSPEKSDPASAVRLATVKALAATKSPAAIEHLSSALVDESSDIRAVAEALLEQLRAVRR